MGASVTMFSTALGLSYLDALNASQGGVVTDEEFRLNLARALLSSKFRVISLVSITFSMVLLVGQFLQYVFFGPLREEERAVGERPVPPLPALMEGRERLENE